jgi:hypothetical protein
MKQPPSIAPVRTVRRQPEKGTDIRMHRNVVWKTARAVRAKSLHLLETLAAQDARTVQAEGKQLSLVAIRLELLLKKDVENQGDKAAVAQKLAEFQHDPRAWLNSNLNLRLGERAQGL